MFKNIEEFREHRERLKDPQYLKQFKLKKEEETKQMWMGLNPFTNAEDVPELPPMNDFYINRIKELGGIGKENLIDNTWYYGDYRNSTLCKWNKNEQEFGLWRYKFGYIWDTCKHFEDDDRFALFVPLRLANEEELETIKKIENEKLPKN